MMNSSLRFISSLIAGLHILDPVSSQYILKNIQHLSYYQEIYSIVPVDHDIHFLPS